MESSSLDPQLQAALVAEYQSLRQEIVQSQMMIIQTIGLSFSAGALLMAQAVAQKNLLLFALTYPVMWLSAAYVTNNRWRIWKMASYIRVMIESKVPGLEWESTLWRIRRSRRLTQRWQQDDILRIERRMYLGWALASTIILGFLIHSSGQPPAVQKYCYLSAAALGLMSVGLICSSMSRNIVEARADKLRAMWLNYLPPCGNGGAAQEPEHSSAPEVPAPEATSPSRPAG